MKLTYKVVDLTRTQSPEIPVSILIATKSYVACYIALSKNPKLADISGEQAGLAQPPLDALDDPEPWMGGL